MLLCADAPFSAIHMFVYSIIPICSVNFITFSSFSRSASILFFSSMISEIYGSFFDLILEINCSSSCNILPTIKIQIFHCLHQIHIFHLKSNICLASGLIFLCVSKYYFPCLYPCIIHFMFHFNICFVPKSNNPWVCITSYIIHSMFHWIWSFYFYGFYFQLNYLKKFALWFFWL